MRRVLLQSSVQPLHPPTQRYQPHVKLVRCLFRLWWHDPPRRRERAQRDGLLGTARPIGLLIGKLGEQHGLAAAACRSCLEHGLAAAAAWRSCLWAGTRLTGRAAGFVTKPPARVQLRC
eukprot:scaffold29716_cov61-Phaeocystis_antarctica.AAC.2